MVVPEPLSAWLRLAYQVVPSRMTTVYRKIVPEPAFRDMLIWLKVLSVVRAWELPPFRKSDFCQKSIPANRPPVAVASLAGCEISIRSFEALLVICRTVNDGAGGVTGDGPP